MEKEETFGMMRKCQNDKKQAWDEKRKDSKSDKIEVEIMEND